MLCAIFIITDKMIFDNGFLSVKTGILGRMEIVIFAKCVEICGG